MADPMVFRALAQRGWADLAFLPFRDGVDICTFCEGEPSVALLRYAAGARVPRHRHMGMETILVLEGAQSDENGRYTAGTLVINPEGTEHSVWSDIGCVVLIQWDRPVRILSEEPAE